MTASGGRAPVATPKNGGATDVFINVPFDRNYRTLYIALIAGLAMQGFRPRSVLEIPPSKSRLERLRGLIRDCGSSVHDLSRIQRSGTPPVPRFNMPFELGLAIGLHADGHSWFVLERTPYRLQRSLSDLNGIDPLVHGGTAKGILRAIANAFESTRRDSSESARIACFRALTVVARKIENAEESLFSKVGFAELVYAGQSAAERLTRGAT